MPDSQPVEVQIVVAGESVYNVMQIDGMIEIVEIQFLRGDSNEDGTVDIADAIEILGALFDPEGDFSCRDMADINDSGGVDIADPIWLLAYLFSNGPPPLEPFPQCGSDLTGPADCKAFNCP